MHPRISSGDPYLNPRDTLPAFQCVCISQIRNRFVLWRNILQGMHNCLNQIKTTGSADAGVCKEIFTQYICKAIHQVLSYFMRGCSPWGGTGKDSDSNLADQVQADSSLP